MDPTRPSTPPPAAGGARPATPATPAAASPTVRDEKRAMRWIAILVAVVVLAVLAFNVMAPKDRLRAPDEAPTPAAGTAAPTVDPQRQQPATTAPGDGTARSTTPEAADSPTPVGREGMGAPTGAVPSVQPPKQDVR